MKERPCILSIAGYDPGAGAGLLADIKTIEAHQGYGMGAMTALTYQNDVDFDGFEWLSVEQVIRQIEVLLQRHTFHAVKIGMIQYPQMFSRVMQLLRSELPDVPVVWDTVLGASSGYDFHEEILLCSEWQHITLATPNIEESVRIFGTEDTAILQKKVQEGQVQAILLKGGHSKGDEVCDYLIKKEEIVSYEGMRFSHITKHGTGCVLSASIATLLGKGRSLEDACGEAKEYIHQFITSNSLRLGYHHML
jgi:hydroxymethylpyrimidine/phosphomethylpyrimidine kinase